MKKTNKISVFYIISSVALMLVLLVGGVYGVYVSVGLNFVKSSVNNFAENVAGQATNVSFGGAVNFESSMTGVIILSIFLIVLGVFDIVSLIKQVIFFKQFKAVRESKIEQNIEKKVKSKGGVIFFAIVLDILSVLAGVAGIFINARSFAGGNVVWVLYVIDALVAILAVLSFVFLIIKLKKAKKIMKENQNENSGQICVDECLEKVNANMCDYEKQIDIDDIEYQLLKLKYLKSSRIINSDEYEKLRQKVIGFQTQKEMQKTETMQK